MVVGCRFNTQEILKFILFVVLFYLLDFARVFKLALGECLLVKVLERKGVLNVLRWHGDGQLGFSLSLFGFFEVVRFGREQTVNFHRHKFITRLVIDGLFDQIAKNNLRLRIALILLFCGFLHKFPLIKSTVLLEASMLIPDESGFLLLPKNRRLNNIPLLMIKFPHEDALTANSPHLVPIKTDIIDVSSMTNVHLMRFPHERIVPYFDKRVISNTEKQVAFQIEVDSVEFVSVEGLHFHFNCHFDCVVSSNGGVLEHNP